MTRKVQSIALGILCIVYAIKGALPALGWVLAKAL